LDDPDPSDLSIYIIAGNAFIKIAESYHPFSGSYSPPVERLLMEWNPLRDCHARWILLLITCVVVLGLNRGWGHFLNFLGASMI
jgi:hypothetical protein